MKKPVGMLLLAVAGTSCQSRMTADKAPVAGAAAVAANAASPAAAATLPVAMLNAYDLSPVLRTLPADSDEIVAPMNGFFGIDRYRIELIFSHVRRDPQQHSRYLIRGKDRYKGHVTPFEGIVELTRVQRQPAGAAGGIMAAAYTALGCFELREAGTHPNAGTFQGRVAVDWAVEKSGKVRQVTPNVKIPQSDGIARSREFEPSTKTPTLGSGILYDGTWTNAAGQTKPAMWATNILSYHGPQVLSNFAVGGRMLNVNPKYARLGWNDYWANDEWWAASPKPRLSL